MKAFGLIGLLITMAIAMVWLTQSGPLKPASDSEPASQDRTYGDILNDAETAARQLEN